MLLRSLVLVLLVGCDPAAETPPRIGESCVDAIAVAGSGAMSGCYEGEHLGCCSQRESIVECRSMPRGTWFRCADVCGTRCFAAAPDAPPTNP